MVEVFKTNVTADADADLLIRVLHKAFPSYKANFDLDDCDRILRIKCISADINPYPIIVLLKDFGFEAMPLPDEHHAGGTLKWSVAADN